MMLHDKLAWALPAFLYIDLFLLLCIFGMWFKPGKAWGYLRNHWRKCILVAATIVLALAVVRYATPRTHRIYYDEDIYLHIAQNISETGKAVLANHVEQTQGQYQIHQPELNKQPVAYPFAVSLLFTLLGTNEAWGFWLNAFAIIAASFLIGFILWILTQSTWAAIMSGVFHFLIPHNLVWANTASAEPFTALLMAACLAIAFSYTRRPSDGKLYLLACVLVPTVQARHESVLIIPVIALLLLIHDPGLVKRKAFWLGSGLFLSLCIPHLLHFLLFRNNPWGNPQGPKFAIKYLTQNFAPNFLYYFQNREFPAILSVFAILGIFLQGQMWKPRITLLAWFACSWGVFLPFYAGSYDYGMDVRFAVLSFGPISILAGMAIHSIHRTMFPKGLDVRPIAMAAVAVSILMLLPKIRHSGHKAWRCHADHHAIVHEFIQAIPSGALVLAQNPQIFALHGQSAAQAHTLYQNPSVDKRYFQQYPGGVYFHWNFWCNVDDAIQNSICNTLLERYEHDLVSEYRRHSSRFALYRLHDPDESAKTNHTNRRTEEN